MDMVNQKMDAHIGHSDSWELKQVLLNSSQAKMDFIQDSNQNRQNQEKVLSPI